MVLSQYLRETGLTQREFAKIARVVQGSLSRYLNGRQPDDDVKARIQKVTQGSVRAGRDWPKLKLASWLRKPPKARAAIKAQRAAASRAKKPAKRINRRTAKHK